MNKDFIQMKDIELKNKIERLIEDVGYIVPFKELCQMDDFPASKRIRNCYKRLYNDTYVNHYIKLGYKKKPIKKDIISYEQVVSMIKEFTNEYNRFPFHVDFKPSNKLYSYDKTCDILKTYNKNLDDVATELGFTRITRNQGYEYWFDKLLDVVKEHKTIKYREFSKYGLPSARWFLNHCPNKNVKNYNDFLEKELRIKVHYGISKESAEKIILKMAKKYNRPLMYDDFANNSEDEVNISAINKYWGTMNKMKEELGLEIIQEDMISKSKTKEELLYDLEKLIKELGRLPLAKEIDECEYTNSSCNYHKYFGGINNAFIQLGYIPNKKSISLNMTNQDIINIYKEFIEDNNVTPSYAYAQDIYILPSPITVIRRFGCTWNEFISMLGYEPNDATYNKSYAKDGTLCNSTGEVVIHNYLLELDINNLNKETYYKDILDDKNLQEKAGFKRLDWTFEYNNKTYYVEYFGMMGYKRYNERHDFKINLITKDNKLDRFIAIYPKDLKNLNKIIKNKLK